jgi:hypothetical protein
MSTECTKGTQALRTSFRAVGRRWYGGATRPSPWWSPPRRKADDTDVGAVSERTPTLRDNNRRDLHRQKYREIRLQGSGGPARHAATPKEGESNAGGQHVRDQSMCALDGAFTIFWTVNGASRSKGFLRSVGRPSTPATCPVLLLIPSTVTHVTIVICCCCRAARCVFPPWCARQ